MKNLKRYNLARYSYGPNNTKTLFIREGDENFKILSAVIKSEGEFIISKSTIEQKKLKVYVAKSYVFAEAPDMDEYERPNIERLMRYYVTFIYDGKRFITEGFDSYIKANEKAKSIGRFVVKSSTIETNPNIYYINKSYKYEEIGQFEDIKETLDNYLLLD